MNKVYILTRQDLDHYVEIEGVFSSQRSAMQRKAEREKEDSQYARFFVNEWDVEKEKSNNLLSPEITDELIVHCKTEDEARLLLAIASEQGYTWADNESLLGETYFYDYCDDTSYRFDKKIKAVFYGDYSLYVARNVLITEFDDFFFKTGFLKEVDMYEMNKELAVALFKEYSPQIWKLYRGDGAMAVTSLSEIEAYNGSFGITKSDFARYAKERHIQRVEEMEVER